MEYQRDGAIDHGSRPFVTVQTFQQHKIESEESLVNVGLSDPFEYTFYTLETLLTKSASTTSDPNIVFGYRYGVSPNLIKHSRSIYTILDWLGDVGGLMDAFIYIGQALMMIFPGSSFATFLASKLFYSAADDPDDDSRREPKRGKKY